MGWRGVQQYQYQPMRVVSVRRKSCLLWGEAGERVGRPSGQFRHQASQTNDLPAVGDWVDFKDMGATATGIIHAVLPRRTLLVRQSPGTHKPQVLCANVDVAFILSAMNREFNLNRLDRYLMLVASANIRPVLILSRADLAVDPEKFVQAARKLASDIPIYALDARSAECRTRLAKEWQEGDTLVLLGSSGVGKSTLVNSLLNQAVQTTSTVRRDGFKGRHTTVSRKLLLCGKVTIIDMPGLKALRPNLTDADLDMLFADLMQLQRQCRFRNCNHTGEPDCAVADALATGQLMPDRWESFTKLKAEQQQADTGFTTR